MAVSDMISSAGHSIFPIYGYYSEDMIHKEILQSPKRHLKNLMTHNKHTTTEVKTWTILIFAYTPLKMT